MSNYDTLLKTWGSLGSEYPSGYSYVEGEQPVDEWDNFLIANIVKDISHVLDLTNERIETDSGLAGNEPTSPESSHLYHDTDNETLSVWDSTNTRWNEMLTSPVGSGDLAENYALVSRFPLSNTDLANSSVTVSTGNNLTGGGTVDLGGTVTIDISDGAGSGLNADLLDGEEASAFADSAHLHDNRYIMESGDTMSGGLTLGDGSTAASRNWTNNNADVPNADYADNAGDADTIDGSHAADLGSGASDGGIEVLSTVTDFNFTTNFSVSDDGDGTVTVDGSHSHSLSDLSGVTATGEGSGNGFDADTVDGKDASAFAVSGHDHDGWYLQKSGGTMSGVLTLNDGSKSASQSWVDSNADVPNADYADTAGDADTVDGEHASAFADAGHNHSLGDLTDVTATGEGAGNGFDADTLDGEHASAFADAGHLHDNRYIMESGDTMSGMLTLSDGSTAASRSWVNANADVPNADYANSAGDANTVDGQHASAFADAGHLHDGRYARLFAGVQNPVYATMNDVPNMTKGEAVFVDGDGLYIEDGN